MKPDVQVIHFQREAMLCPLDKEIKRCMLGGCLLVPLAVACVGLQGACWSSTYRASVCFSVCASVELSTDARVESTVRNVDF